MGRSTWRRAGAIPFLSFVLACVGISTAYGQYNPNGFIRTDAWNMLFMDQAYSGNLTAGIAYPGGGPVFAAANWVAPHDIGAENPKAGDVWADIAFVAVPTPGPRAWTQLGLGASPLWVSTASLTPLLAAALPGPVADPPIGDVVDFQTIADRIRQIPDPDLAATVTDNAVAIATTYVRNNTGSDMYVQFGTASDDGMRLDVNNVKVLVRSDARGVPGTNLNNIATGNPEFEEWSGAILPPGISKITAHVWEGGGGWGLRIGIIRNGGLLKDGNGDIDFLGAGAGDPLIIGQVQPADAAAFQSNNPFGWIVAKAWNFLGPLETRFGSEGGGPRLMLQNWVYPHDIVKEDPKSGDEWDIDYMRAGATAYAARHFAEAAGMSDKPTWFTFQDLADIVDFLGGAALLPLPGSGIGRDPYGRGDVNLEDLYRFLSARVIRPAGLPTIDLKLCDNPGDFNVNCDPDNLLTLATTYVRNRTGADLPIQVVSASDDSIQVWINCQLVTSSSFGRGTARFAADVREGVLPPGISKIAILVFEGGGGHGFRVGLRPVGSNYNYSDGNPAIEFLGNGGSDDAIVGTKQFCLERQASNPQEGVYETATITIKGNGEGAAGNAIQVVERISAYDLSQAEITEVSGGGVVSETVVARDDMYTNVSTTGNDTWAGCDSFQFDYAPVAGDFDVSIEFILRAHSGDDFRQHGKIGLMAREGIANNNQFQMVQDRLPNLTIGIQTARRRASVALQGGTTAPCGNIREDAGIGGTENTLKHPRFMRIKRVGQVFSGWVSNRPGLADGSLDPASDANWTLNFSDNWAVAGNNATAANPLPNDIYVGFANSEHNSSFADFQKIVYRILPGSNNAGAPLADWAASILIGTDNGGQSATTRGGSVVTEKVITWNTTIGAVNTGLTYKLRYKLMGRTTNPPVRTTAFATDAPRVINGPPINPRLDSYHLNFFPEQTGPIGDLENAHDIGFMLNPRTPGSTEFDDATKTYTLKGSGTDAWNDGDRMQIAYKQVTGDFVATVRITDMQMPDSPKNDGWGRGGIMARYTGDHESKYSLACVEYRGIDPANSRARRHQTRRDHLVAGNGRDNQVLPQGLLTQPYTGWVRLTRIGKVLASHFADDLDGEPVEWFLAGTDYHSDPPDTLMIGILAGSHNTASPVPPAGVSRSGAANPLFITYDNWSVESLAAPATTCRDDVDVLVDDFEAGLDPATSTVTAVGAFVPAVVGGRLRIIQDGTANNATSIWLAADGVGLGDSGFTAEFDAYTAKTGADPADGFTFAVVEGEFATAAGFVGDGGGGMGYNRGDHNQVPPATLAPPHSRRTSFAVEFDYWNGGAGDNDPVDKAANNGRDEVYHIGIDVNTDQQSCQNTYENGLLAPFFLNSADGLHVEVNYDPSDRQTGTAQVEVYVTANDGSFDRTKMLSSRVPILRGDVFLGFTGGTGGASMTAEVDNLAVKARCCEMTDTASIAQQAPVELSVQDVVTLDGSGSTGADGAFAYTWELLSGSASFIGPATGPMPQLALTGSGTVRVRLSLRDGSCGDGASAEMSFEVLCNDPAEVAAIAGAPAGTTAINAPVVLDGGASSAGAGDAKPFTYAWSIDSGPGGIEGSATGSTVTVKGTAAGVVAVKLVIDDGRCGNPASATANVCVDDADTAMIVAPAGPYGVGSPVVLDSAGSSAGARAWSIVSGAGAIVGAANGNTVSIKGNATGDVVVGLKVDDGACNNAGSAQVTLTFAVLTNWVRCDSNGDNGRDLTDAVFSLNFQFLAGPASPCPGSLDCNKDGSIDLTDAVFDLNYQFLAGPPPAAPYPECDLFEGCDGHPKCP